MGAISAAKGVTQFDNNAEMAGPEQIMKMGDELARIIGEYVDTIAELPADGATLNGSENWPGRVVSVYEDGTVRLWTNTTSGMQWKIVGGARLDVPAPTMAANWTLGGGSKLTRRGNVAEVHLLASRSSAIAGAQAVLTFPEKFRPTDTIAKNGLLVSGASPGFVGVSVDTAGVMSILALSVTAATTMRFDFEFPLA